MRITNRMAHEMVLADLQRSLGSMMKSQEKLSTAKRVNRPSDDPTAAHRAISSRAQLMVLDQFNRNIGEVKAWVNTTEYALRSVSDALIEVRTLAIQAANDTLSPSDRENIAQRIDEFNELIFKLTHERYSGRYVFSGTRTDDPPFVRDGDDVIYQGNSAHIRVNIGEGAPVAFNLTGDEVFMGIGDQGRSLFKLLSDLAAAIRQGDARRVGGELLGEIDEALARVAEKLGVVGAVAQRLEKMEEVISGLMVKHKELLSLAEDADLAEAVMDFQFKQTAYQASLAACARAIMPTILDYLK